MDWLRQLRLAAFIVSGLLAACSRSRASNEQSLGAAELQASATERRIALIVGNNVGSGERPPLRYAEQDAAKLARALSDVAGFAAKDVHLLQGGSLAALREKLQTLRGLVEATKRTHPASRVLLIFYYSGHSDGQALELGRDRLSFSELRQNLRDTLSDVRLGIIDACHSGALIGIKGGKPGKGFDVTLFGLPALSGEVFLSASRADEVALESREIAGSFFTHHLISGLRGAADADRNYLVSLEELYRHTAARTSSAAAGSLFGGQTPAYDYRLVGHGDLVLSDLRGARQVIYLPGGFDRVVILQQPSGIAEAEAGMSSGLPIALPVGEYVLRGQRDGLWYRSTARVQATAGHVARISDFVQEAPPAATRIQTPFRDRARLPTGQHVFVSFAEEQSVLLRRH